MKNTKVIAYRAKSGKKQLNVRIDNEKTRDDRRNANVRFRIGEAKKATIFTFSSWTNWAEVSDV